MFTISGKIAYTNAYAICDRQTKAPHHRGVLKELRKTRDDLSLLVDTYVARSYPVELKRILAGITGLSGERPLWLYHVEERILVVSPRDRGTKTNDIMGDTFMLQDLQKVKSRIKKLTLSKKKERSLHLENDNYSSELLTVYQIFQLLSIGKGALPKTIEFEFIKLAGGGSELYGNVTFQSPEGQEFKIDPPLHLCHNTRGPTRISDPPKASDLNRISFFPFDKERKYNPYDTVFELNPSLVTKQ